MKSTAHTKYCTTQKLPDKWRVGTASLKYSWNTRLEEVLSENGTASKIQCVHLTKDFLMMP